MKNYLSKLENNLRGKRIKDKILVFESDDWGTIRMASKKAFNDFKKQGFQVDNCPYNKYDAIETNNDIDDLANVLTRFRDIKGNPAVFTLNQIVANPDFAKIRDSKFQEYHYESVLDTLKKYPNSDLVYDKMRKGIDEKIFDIQFHGREHLDVKKWMEALRANDKFAITAFDQEMFSLYNKENNSASVEFLEAFGGVENNISLIHEKIIDDGLQLFEEIWERQPKSFIAPCYIWSEKLERILNKHHVKHIQGGFVQKKPTIKKGIRFEKKRHYFGEKNKFNQIYTVRNVIFEPAQNKSIDWINTALKDIKMAFTFHKPAVVSSHRLNYVGRLDESNKAKNLGLLNTLLSKVQKLYPDVLFMSSDQLVELLH